MAQASKIEWTWSSWNPVTGCSKVSAGCRYCYAERMALRLQKIGQKKYKNGFKVTLHNELLTEPLKWKKPQIIFVNSMSDIFHEDIPEDFIINMFGIMQKANWHTFQILTKRSARLVELAEKLPWSSNIWMGVTVENADYIYRINDLGKVPAQVRFVSMEPLLGPIPEFPYNLVDWLILGGESGPHARPMSKSWVIEIRNQCLKHNIPFFFKQWGGFNKKKNGRLLDGKYWDEKPEFPALACQLGF
jgi:protein gp37